MKSKLMLITTITLLMLASICYSYENVLVLDRTPFAYELATVTTAAVVRLDETNRDIAGAVFITIETNNIRYRIDSGDPSITNGHLVVATAYQNIWLTDRYAIRNFRMIGIGGNSTVHITYYRRN